MCKIKDLTRFSFVRRQGCGKPEKQEIATFFAMMKIIVKIFKKGIDFVMQSRYNVELYENNEKGVPTMPNIKSSKKDVIRSKVAYEKNKADKSELKTNLKKFDAALVAGDKAAAEAAYKTAVKSVDQAVIKGLLHKNNAARKKSSMTLKLNKLA